MHKLIQDEEGFTLIELLVVILIIGILAAIALPSFIGQQQKAQDTDAKSNARSLVEHIESCYSTEIDYTRCTAALMPPTGLPIGPAKGQVDVAPTSANAYVVTAKSRSGGTFTVTRDNVAGTFVRGCSGGSKGCIGGTW